MNKYLFIFIVLIVSVAFFACQQQEPIAEQPTPSVQDITLAKKNVIKDNGSDKFLVLFNKGIPTRQPVYPGTSLRLMPGLYHS